MASSHYVFSQRVCKNKQIFGFFSVVVKSLRYDRKTLFDDGSFAPDGKGA